MFQSVRHWWTGGRGKVTLRLFVFEFVVVVAGVLVAQWLAGTVARRADIERMRASERLALAEMEANYGAAVVWRTAGPCLERRLADVMQEASTGAVPAQMLVRPRVLQFVQTPFPSDEYRTLVDLEGVDRGDIFKIGEVNAFNAAGHVRAVVNAWGRLELVNAGSGTISAEDRSLARAAAADIRASIKSVNVIGDDIIRRSAEAGLKPDFDERGNGPARDCTAIWKGGQINPPLGTR